MNIALMTNNYKPVTGGVPISVERLAAALREQWHEVTIFAPTYREQQEEEGVFRYRTCLNRFVGGIVLPNAFDRRIDEEFRKQSFDIIHVHHPVLIGNTAVWLSHKYQIPLVFTYHTRYEKYLNYYTGGIFDFSRLMQIYLRSFLKRCDFVFAPTRGMEGYLLTDCHVPAEKVGILPTGLVKASYTASPEESWNVRKRYDAENIPLLMTVSRMAREKNLDFLLEALAETKKLYEKPFRVLFVGDGPDRNKLEQKSDFLGLRDTVIFTGSIPNSEIAAYYKAADCFVFASKTETQGIVIAEAFAGGTPVLAVRASGVEDLVLNGENGILTEENIRIYAARLTEFLKSPDKRRTMAEKAYAAGLEYREEAVAEEAIRRYNEVIAAIERRNEEKKCNRKGTGKNAESVSYSYS